MMYQLRIYTLKDRASAEDYLENHWDKHLRSLPKFGITVHNVFGERTTHGKCHIFALVSGNNLLKLNKEYMKSQDFINDMKGFDMNKILDVKNVNLFENKKIQDMLNK